MRRSAVLAAAFVALYVVASWGTPIVKNDSGSYFDWNARLVGLPERVYTVPAAFLLVARNAEAIVVMHTVVGAAGWLLLLWAVRDSLRDRWLRTAVPLLVALLALSHLGAAWNRFVLSEGLSVGLLPWLVAVSILAVRAPTRWSIGAWLLVWAAWVCTRPAHLFLALLFALVAVVVLLLDRSDPRRRLLAAGGVAVVLVAAPYLFDTGGRVSRFNEASLVVDRVLVDPALRAHFEEAGLPVSDAVEEEAGDFGWAASAALDEDDALVEWNRRHFLPTYGEYAVRHPAWALAEPATDLRGIAPPGGQVDTWRAVLSRPVDDVLTSGWLLALLAAAMIGLGLVAAVRRVRPSAVLVVAVGLLVGAIVEHYAIWHLSITEPVRLHAAVAVMVPLGLLLASGWLLDDLLAQRVQGGARSGSTS